MSLKYSALTVLCGTILVAGFFFAARQHFSTMDYGIKNSRLRKQMDELEAEKRRLLLNREISLSPSELMKAARKIGFNQYISGGQDTGGPTAISATKTRSETTNVHVVQKTVISKPIEPIKGSRAPVPAKAAPQAKKETANRDKKYKS